MYETGKKFRYDPSIIERRLKPLPGQIRFEIEVSIDFRIECSRWARYDYPLNTIFRLDVKVLKKSNKASYYNYYDEYYLRSTNQELLSVEEYEKSKKLL